MAKAVFNGVTAKFMTANGKIIKNKEVGFGKAKIPLMWENGIQIQCKVSEYWWKKAQGTRGNLGIS